MIALSGSPALGPESAVEPPSQSMLNSFVPLLAFCAPRTISHPVRVYIEDTDAYQVVYHGNYLRFFERAAAATISGTTQVGKLLRSDGLGFGLLSASGLKYSTPAVLGDACHVDLKPHEATEADGIVSCAAALIRNRDGEVLCTASDLRLGWVGAVSAIAACADEPLGEYPAACESPELLEPLSLQLDECSPVGTLGMHAAVRYFERHRTHYLGGPENLAAMADTGVNVVVARINGLRLLPEAHRTRAGAPLVLRCRVTLKARQVLFEQWLLRKEDAADGMLTPVARADVTCLCVDAAAGRLVAAPAEVADRLKSYMI